MTIAYSRSILCDLSHTIRSLGNSHQSLYGLIRRWLMEDEPALSTAIVRARAMRSDYRMLRRLTAPHPGSSFRDFTCSALTHLTSQVPLPTNGQEDASGRYDATRRG
jgi:hypothetical protein